MRRVLALAAALTLVSGCATIASKSDEAILVTTEPSGAEVAVDCGSGRSVHVTPARLEIARRTPDCTLTLQKAGFEKETLILEQGVNRWTWANVPIAALGVGFIGMSGFSNDPNEGTRVGGALVLAGLGGMAVDRLTWRLRDHDPKTVHVKLRPAP
jgi:hypothetical protein